MGNPYPANFTQPDGSVRLSGDVVFTDAGNQPGGGGSYAAGTDRFAATQNSVTVTHGNAAIVDWTGAQVFVRGTAIALVGAFITFVEAGCYYVQAHLSGGMTNAGATVPYELSIFPDGTEYADGADTSGPAGLAHGGQGCNFVWCFNAGDTFSTRIAVDGPDDGTGSVFATVVKLSNVAAGDEFA